MKILIQQQSSMADYLLWTPIIRLMHDQLSADITLLHGHHLSKKEINHPNVRFITSPEEVAEESFDWLINVKGKKIQSIRADQTLSINENKFKEWLFIYLKINKLPAKHWVDHCIDQLSPLGLSHEAEGIEYFIPEKDEVEMSWLPETHQNGYVLFALQADHETMKLPLSRAIELCDRINKPIVLIGNTEDLATASAIESFFTPGSQAYEQDMEELNKKATIFNGCGKFSFNQTASLIQKSSVVFCYASEYMHVAAAFERKLFTIWGSSSPLFGKYPYRAPFTIFENNKLGCRPCSSGGYSKCPKNHFRCMHKVTFDFYLPD